MNKLERCHRCHGYKIQGTIPESVICRQCRKPASIVCVVCLKGIHRLGECILGHGANRAYNQLPDEKVPACPHCAWEWCEFISKDPCNNFMQQEAGANVIMNRDAIITCPGRKEALKSIKNYTIETNNVKMEKLVDKTYVALSETFRMNPHREDYKQIIHEVIKDLI